MSNSWLENIIRQTVQGIGLQTDAPTAPAVAMRNCDGKAIAVFAGYVHGWDTCKSLIGSRYGENIAWLKPAEGYVPSPEGVSCGIMDEAAMAKEAGEASAVVIIAPQLAMLRRIAQGDDSGALERVAIKALLWGKRVALYLDFSLERCKELYPDMKAVLDDLSQKGVELLDCGEQEAKTDCGCGGLTLVTEEQVIDAAKQGSAVLCAKNAIVTPLAKDKAAELGIQIREWSE